MAMSELGPHASFPHPFQLFASLSFEIALMRRVLRLALYHFAFMVISIAMLGIAGAAPRSPSSGLKSRQYTALLLLLAAAFRLVSACEAILPIPRGSLGQGAVISPSCTICAILPFFSRAASPRPMRGRDRSERGLQRTHGRWYGRPCHGLAPFARRAGAGFCSSSLAPCTGICLRKRRIAASFAL